MTKSILSLLLLLVLLNGCAEKKHPPPTDEEIKAAIENHVHRLIGNGFKKLTINDFKRLEPREQHVADIGRAVTTYPVSFRLHIETSNGPIDDVDPDAAYFWDHDELKPVKMVAAKPAK